MGIEINHDADGMTIHQERYIEEMLSKYGMENANGVKTPMETAMTEETLQQDKEKAKLIEDRSFNALQYVYSRTRPDIGFAVYLLSTRPHIATNKDENAAKRILRYLKETKENYLV